MHQTNHMISGKADKILSNKLFGIIIFIGVIWLVFQATFGLGHYPMIWLADLFFLIEDFLLKVMPDSIFRSLLVNGILKGIGGVIIFLPNIIILFSLLSILEESGYMARVALVMDRIMRPLGMNGKSFMSLVMGFGCNVPAIMAAQSIENKNSRIITILINPLMSCSSRFTVYVLFISAFFPEHPGTVLFFVYLTSVVIAGVMALVLKKYIFKETYELYNEGLPAYRLPKLKRILRFMWHNAKMFINKIIGAILIASIVIWFLGYFPNNRENKNIESSYLGMTGKFIEPAIAPLGFDWRMGISLISGIAAKETIVGLMSQLYQTEHRPGSDKQNLIESLRTQTYTIGPRQGQNIFNPVVALSFIFFVSLYTPCVATIASIHKTVKKRKWTVMVILYTTLLAWLVSFMIYHIGSNFLL
ncbi:MAG TPA: ferrous iron transport protein B [Bacteroidales bacterium]|nr:ferrous iron transport protein B [Bacteroidales bacterium]HPS27527.1 ferrous iron transport protein B [Bacteroidales bacterium]